MQTDTLLELLTPANLTPDELAELKALAMALPNPVDDHGLSTIPLEVRIQLLESAERAGCKDGEPINLAALDLPDSLKAKLAETARIGTWPGPPATKRVRLHWSQRRTCHCLEVLEERKDGVMTHAGLVPWDEVEAVVPAALGVPG